MKNPRTFIDKYTSYFHDGIVHDIKHLKKNITISIESAQLLPEWNLDNIVLSNRDTISGNLHLEEVKIIFVNRKIHNNKLIKTYDDGSIYHFGIQNNKMILQVSWENYPPKQREETDVFTIEIEAEKITWENIPTLFDASWKES